MWLAPDEKQSFAAHFCANSLPFCLQKKEKTFQAICYQVPVANNACRHLTRFDLLINLPGSKGKLKPNVSFPTTFLFPGLYSQGMNV